jgi:TIR domain
MAYVPGLANDVFVSYSHIDNKAALPGDLCWVNCLEEALTQQLAELGIKARFWQDRRRLGGEMDFSREIQDALASCAVLLTVVSPPYLSSDYCEKEVQWFENAASASGGLCFKNMLRVLKTIKTPELGDAHRSFQPLATGFEFYRWLDDDKQTFQRYAVGDREYRAILDNLAQRLAGLLRAMRNSRQAIYLARPGPDVESEFKKLRDELTDRGYRVVPERWLGASEPQLLEEAVMGAQILSALPDQAALDQLRLLLDRLPDARKPLVLWTPADSLPEAAALLIDRAQRPGWPLTVIERGRGVSDLKTIILDQLKPQPVRTAATANGKPRVYLLCDRKAEADFSQAWRIRKLIAEQENFEVFLPDAPPDPALIREDQKEKLERSDGVLIYWQSASRDWLEQAWEDVRIAPRLLRANRDFRSQKVCAAGSDSEILDAFPKDRIIRMPGEFRYEALEPFLAPLRVGAAA